MTLHDDPRHDAVMVLVKARVNVGLAVKGKTIRKLTVDTGPIAAVPAPPRLRSDRAGMGRGHRRARARRVRDRARRARARRRRAASR